MIAGKLMESGFMRLRRVQSSTVGVLLDARLTVGKVTNLREAYSIRGTGQ